MKSITQFVVLLVVSAACAPVPAPETPTLIETPTPTSMAGMVHPTATPGEAIPATAIPAPMEPFGDGGQELAVIQELYDHYWPDPLILILDLPTILYAVTDGREHINLITIGPFAEAPNMRPGQVFTIAFSPDEGGTFEIVNVGHRFSGKLLVAANCADAEQIRINQGGQAFAIIHSPVDGRLFPDTITVRVGLPVTLYNFSVGGEHLVSVELLVPDPIIVRPNSITQMQFTPEQVGEYAIIHADDDLAGLLVVRESACPDV
ncbi:MAG: hypothetical protein IIC78_01120 [Chloroflexi bacterium]|nr:hypothetical protein [Chloroflexota bacterium]